MQSVDAGREKVVLKEESLRVVGSVRNGASHISESVYSCPIESVTLSRIGKSWSQPQFSISIRVR